MTLIFIALVALLAVEITGFLNNLMIVRNNIKTYTHSIDNLTLTIDGLKEEREYLKKGIEKQNKELETNDKFINQLLRRSNEEETKYIITPDGVKIWDEKEYEKQVIDGYKKFQETQIELDKILEKEKNNGE